MKKILSIALAAALVFACSAALAQEQEKKTGPTIVEWLKSMQRKIDQIVPKKTIPVSTGVAGVRGAKEDTQVKLYWKGKKGEEAVAEEELACFRKGLDLASNGDNPGAARELEAFMKQYPDSALIPDAKKTLDLVKTEAQDAAPAAK
jgi:TolA-binding protein